MTTPLKGLALGLVVAVAGMLAAVSPQGRDIEQSVGLSWLYHLRGAMPPPADVMVVAIDRQSAQALKLADKASQWPRSLHAQLVGKLAQAGASVIVFDLTFDTASRDIEHDQALAAAMRKARNVVLVALLQRDRIARSDRPGAAGVSIETVVPPIPMLANAASAYAPFVLPKTERVDAYWTFKPGAGDSPTLPVVAFQIYALQAYDELVALWRQAGAPPAAWLPASRDAGHPYDPKRPKPPKRVDIRLVVQGKELVPILGDNKKRAPRAIAQVMDLQRPISFGIVSNTRYWVACNQNDHSFHLYSSDGLGSVADLGSVGVAC